MNDFEMRALYNKIKSNGVLKIKKVSFRDQDFFYVYYKYADVILALPISTPILENKSLQMKCDLLMLEIEGQKSVLDEYLFDKMPFTFSSPIEHDFYILCSFFENQVAYICNALDDACEILNFSPFNIEKIAKEHSRIPIDKYVLFKIILKRLNYDFESLCVRENLTGF